MNRHLVLPAALLCSASCVGFYDAIKPFETTVAEALISDEQELQLGLQVHQELQKDPKNKFSTSPKVIGYVQGIVNKLTPTANKERQVPWKLYVIDDAKTVNAFAVPGGGIYVYSGLLLMARNEAQVAGVLGHEMGHVVARHTARRLITAKGMDIVASMALGNQPNEVADLVASLAGGGAILAYGREMENDADEFGVRYAHYADYDSGALGDFFQLLKNVQGDTNAVEVWLSSHPAHEERIAHIRAFKANGGFQGKVVGAELLAPIQADIKATMLSAAAASPAAQATPPPANKPAPQPTQPAPVEHPTSTPVHKNAPPGAH